MSLLEKVNALEDWEAKIALGYLAGRASASGPTAERLESALVYIRPEWKNELEKKAAIRAPRSEWDEEVFGREAER